MYKKAFKTINQYNTISVDFKKSEQLGYVPIKPEARSLLFELFAKLYEQTSIIITTHLKFTWIKFYSIWYSLLAVFFRRFKN